MYASYSGIFANISTNYTGDQFLNKRNTAPLDAVQPIRRGHRATAAELGIGALTGATSATA